LLFRAIYSLPSNLEESWSTSSSNEAMSSFQSEREHSNHSLHLLSRVVFSLPSNLEKFSSTSSSNEAMSSLQSKGEHPFVRHYHSVVQRQKMKYIMVPKDEMQELMALYGPDNFVERKVSEPAEHQQQGTI
jgi:hypothetical protein